MQARSEDQPFPERQTSRNDPEAGRHAQAENATPPLPTGPPTDRAGNFEPPFRAEPETGTTEHQ